MDETLPQIEPSPAAEVIAYAPPECRWAQGARLLLKIAWWCVLPPLVAGSIVLVLLAVLWNDSLAGVSLMILLVGLLLVFISGCCLVGSLGAMVVAKRGSRRGLGRKAIRVAAALVGVWVLGSFLAELTGAWFGGQSWVGIENTGRAALTDIEVIGPGVNATGAPVAPGGTGQVAVAPARLSGPIVLEARYGGTPMTIVIESKVLRHRGIRKQVTIEPDGTALVEETDSR